MNSIDIEPSVRCVIEAKPNFPLGDVPEITVSILNDATFDIYLVGCLDASASKDRYPHCYYEVIGPDGLSAVYEPKNWCGYINELRTKDLVQVPAGQSFDPYQRIDGGLFPAYQLSKETFAKPGTYRITFHYSTNSRDAEDWVIVNSETNQDRKELERLLDNIPKLSISSNELTITIGSD